MSRPSFRALVALAAVVVLSVEAWSAPNPATSVPSDPFTTAQLDVARSVRERALEDDTAYELLRSLTSRVGPRSAGSPGDARAVEWAQAQLKSLGFVNVHAEPVRVPHWVRGECHVETVSPWTQRLVAEALGDELVVDPRAVRRSRVDDREAERGASDLAVRPAHVRVHEHDGAIGAAASGALRPCFHASKPASCASAAVVSIVIGSGSSTTAGQCAIRSNPRSSAMKP